MSYTYTKVTDLEKTTMVGNHQCVALVRHYAGAPATLAWKQGEAVLGNRGIIVMDQWSGKRLGIVTSRTLRSKGQ